MRRWLSVALVIAGLLVVAAPLVAHSEPTAEELERNRKKLAELANHPEQLERLRRDAEAFLTLPEPRRAQLLQLAHDLHKKSAPAQARLGGVMERYSDWLAKQPEEDRKRIDEAPDKASRLAIIRELRDQEYIKHQPRATRDQYEKLKDKSRTDFIKSLRQEERKRRRDWQIAKVFWTQLEKGVTLDARLNDLPKDVQNYVNDYLKMFLSKDEKERLENAEGKWPQYMLTLVELADKHPPALMSRDGPKTYAALPKDLDKFRQIKKTKWEGRWPDFAIHIVDMAKRRTAILPHELWAYNYGCLGQPMKDFHDKNLLPNLSSDEKIQLLQVQQQAKWPEFTQTIQDLARAHNLTPPWFTLPGPSERWDAYRQIISADRSPDK
ncbi:MAG: hypothetical protein HY040_27495 [Planctomycetes bacterium]|nr:hypothetical protein [Planctomycetota bacterium]